jgi:hypothetical protein
MWNLVNNAYVIKFAKFSSFCNLIGGWIWLVETTNTDEDESSE